jgi:hypothetical protein
VGTRTSHVSLRHRIASLVLSGSGWIVLQRSTQNSNFGLLGRGHDKLNRFWTDPLSADTPRCGARLKFDSSPDDYGTSTYFLGQTGCGYPEGVDIPRMRHVYRFRHGYVRSAAVMRSQLQPTISPTASKLWLLLSKLFSKVDI